jgi:fluoride exporter
MSRFLLVCAGGALGSGARYLLGTWAAATWGTHFPWGTLVINVAGSFLISVVMVLGLETGAVGPELRLLLAVGVLGGFTTYSSFNYEALALLQRGDAGLAAAYVAATLLGAMAAGAAGLLLARAVASGW